jgi:hypothetical protein
MSNYQYGIFFIGCIAKAIGDAVAILTTLQIALCMFFLTTL